MDSNANTDNFFSTALISIEEWTAIQETLYLLSIPGLTNSVQAGMREPLWQGSSELLW